MIWTLVLRFFLLLIAVLMLFSTLRGFSGINVYLIIQVHFFYFSNCRFMLETLRQAKSFRPQQLWGFYLFPDCYNHNYRSNLDNYTGRCPDVEMTRNDQLRWLWTESTALYPSIYMSRLLKDRAIGRQFVRNRVREGMRLASVGNGTARPVFVYTRPTYANELTLLSEVRKNAHARTHTHTTRLHMPVYLHF